MSMKCADDVMADRRKLKNDMILIGVLLLAAAAGLFAFRLMNSEPGETVRVSAENRVYGEYPLREDRVVEIPGAIGTCVLEIRAGRADMISADCPNQICVQHAEISNTGEMIICLPNKVSVEIIADAD